MAVGVCREETYVLEDEKIFNRVKRIAELDSSSFAGMEMTSGLVYHYFKEAILPFVEQLTFPLKDGSKLAVYSEEQIDQRIKAVEFAYGVIK